MTNHSLPDVRCNDTINFDDQDGNEENENYRNAQKNEFHVNELLAYVSHYIHNSNISNIKKVVLSFYQAEDIVQSKKLLWNICKEYLDKYTDRRNTDRRTCDEANLDDMIDALQQLDTKSKIPIFVARDMDKIPDRQPEELNLISIINRINQVKKKIKEYNDAYVFLHEMANDARNIATGNREVLHEQDGFIKTLFTLNKENKLNFENEDYLCQIKKIVNDEIKEQKNMQLNVPSDYIDVDKGSTVKDFLPKLSEQNVMTETNDENDLIDNDILVRFNRLKNYDDSDISLSNDINNNSFSLKEFESFLDSFDKDRRESASISHFKSELKKNNTEFQQNNRYSNAVKNYMPDKNSTTCKKNNEQSFKGANFVVKNGQQVSPTRIMDAEGFTLCESRSTLKKRKKLEYSKYNLKGAPIPTIDIFVYKILEGESNDVRCYLEAVKI